MLPVISDAAILIFDGKIRIFCCITKLECFFIDGFEPFVDYQVNHYLW